MNRFVNAATAYTASATSGHPSKTDINDLWKGLTDFGTVPELIADDVFSYLVAANKEQVVEGQQILAGGIRYIVAASTATDHDLITVGLVKFYSTSMRNSRGAAIASGIPDGTVTVLDGLAYQADSSATGTASVTNDLSVPGLIVPPGTPADPRHYGAKADGVTDDHAILARLLANEEYVNFGAGNFRSSSPLEFRSGQTIRGLYRSTVITFDAGSDGFIPAGGGSIEKFHLSDLSISRPSTTVEQTALDFDNTLDAYAQRIVVENFSRVISNARTTGGLYCWRNTFRDIDAFQCKEFYHSPHNIVSGVTFRANENKVENCYAGDVGRWDEHVGILVGGIGNTFSRIKLAQSVSSGNVGGIGIHFGEFSSENTFHDIYHEGSYPFLWSSDVTSVARQNFIDGHHVDTPLNPAPTISDPLDSVDAKRGQKGTTQSTPARFGPKTRGLQTVGDASVHIYGEYTKPAQVIQTRDGQAKTKQAFRTAETDAVGSREIAFTIVGQGFLGGGSPNLEMEVEGVIKWKWDNNLNMLPKTTQTVSIGSSALSLLELHSQKHYAGTAFWSSGTGTPEGAVAAPVGSTYSRTDGGAGTSFYVKESGSGNTGWVAK